MAPWQVSNLLECIADYRALEAKHAELVGAVWLIALGVAIIAFVVGAWWRERKIKRTLREMGAGVITLTRGSTIDGSHRR